MARRKLKARGPSGGRSRKAKRSQPDAGGVTVRTFSEAPANFNPLKASRRQLRAYGYPPRPDATHLLERWEAVFSRGIRFITPTFRRMDYRPKRLPKRAGSTPRSKVETNRGTETLNIWSGAVVRAASGDPFSWIEGTWTVPDVYPPAGAFVGEWYSASTWVGIDGLDVSMDVLQAGCDSDVMIVSVLGNRFVIRQIQPWWEWFPGDTYWISNLPVSFGDTVSCVICADPGSTTDATVYFYNLTNGVAASFIATAPKGFQLTGNCAEWIVERIPVDNSPPELARFGEVYFDECHAGTANGLLVNAGSGDTIDMLDAPGVIAAAAFENDTLVQVRYTGK